MALLYVKKLLFSGGGQTRPTPELGYSRIEASNSFDVEQAAALSQHSSNTSDFEFVNEKQSLHDETTVSSMRFFSARLLSDFTIGLSDGLTVPFALTAGLSALGDARVVVFGGLAELIAGAISMGVAGYLGAKGEREAQRTSIAETTRTLDEQPQEALRRIRDQFQSFDLPCEILDVITRHYSHLPKEELLPHLLRLQSVDQDPSRQHHPYLSGLTISFAYFFGGFVPLLPYLFAATVQTAFYFSVGITAVVLFTFGCTKTALVGDRRISRCLKGGIEMFVLGGVAAAAAVICVKSLS